MDEVLDFYFQIQSLSMTTDEGSVLAATLANGGVCPLSRNSCMSPASVRDTLSTMHSCGLQDYSGRWAFEVSIPECCLATLFISSNQTLHSNNQLLWV